MAIVLDYFLKKDQSPDSDETILSLVIADEDGLTKVFNESDIDRCSEFLGMRTNILTYDKTIRRVYPYLTRDFITDYELNKKVFDIAAYLKKLTGHDISLSQLALATLGTDMELTRLPKEYDDSSLSEIEEKLEARAGYIKNIWDYGISNGYLVYYIRKVRKTVEVVFNDNYSSQ